MKFTWFIGIDVSKASLDVAFCQQNHPTLFSYQQFDHTRSGFKSLLKWLSKQKVDSQASLFCMEHTGHYTLALCCFLQDNHLAYTLISPLHVKKSLGITPAKMTASTPKVSANLLACIRFR
jgi:transposase